MTAYVDAMSGLFARTRPRLFGIAYGMLGSVMEAEDVVQDVFEKWTGLDTSGIESPAAYLTTMTTRMAIDRLRSARHRRETYIGPWLPEPLVTSPEPDPAAVVAEAEQLSMALLMTFERLNPVERAVLLLRDVFDFDYAEIAEVVAKSPANCRQIAVRARTRVAEPARSRPTRETEERLAIAYGLAISQGDVDTLVELLAEDVVMWADGGGKARAARQVLAGAERVAKFLINVNRHVPADIVVTVVRVNGTLGFAGHVGDVPYGVVTFDIVDERIVAIRSVLNPDKLRHLHRPA